MSLGARLSVVTAVRNDRAGLDLTLASVQRELPAAEHVIVDGTVPPLLDQPPRPEVALVTGRDRGISHAFNRGVMAARRDYVLFVNAGDWFVDGAGPAVHAALEGSTADVVWFSVYRRDAAGQDTLYAPRLRWLKYAMSAPHQGMVVRRDVFAQIGLFPMQRYAMDHHLALRVVASRPPFRIECRTEPIAVYPAGGHSTQGGVKPFVANCRNVLAIWPRHFPGAVAANLYLAAKSAASQWRKGP